MKTTLAVVVVVRVEMDEGKVIVVIIFFVAFNCSLFIRRFERRTVECTDRYHLAHHGDVGSGQLGVQVHKVHTVLDDLRLDLRAGGTQHRSLRRHHASHELFRVVETC